MGEFILKDMAVKAGRSVLGVNCDSEDTADFEIASAATSFEEIGNPVYPPAKRKLAENGIGVSGNELGVSAKRARRLTQDDYDHYDLIICMDQYNLRDIGRILGDDTDGKVKLMLDYTERVGQEVADPWYTGNFDATWRDVTEGCKGLLELLGEG